MFAGHFEVDYCPILASLINYLKTKFQLRSLELASPIWASIRFIRTHRNLLRQYRKTGWYLFIDRPIFGYEIETVAKRQSINTLPISARFCKSVFTHILPGDLVNVINDYNYHQQIKNAESSRARLSKYWHSYLRTLRTLTNLKGVVSCNYIYALHIELNRACIKQAIPFFVIFKESINSEHSMYVEMFKRYEPTKFLGTKILVYNHVCQDALNKLPGIDEKHISVVGFPRADELLTLSKNKVRGVREKILTLFWSDLNQKSELYPLEFRQEIKRNVTQFYINLLRFALDRKDYKMRIKLKINSQVAQVEELAMKHQIVLGEDIEIVKQGDPFPLFVDTDVVCGFNSTTLVEGLASGAVVLEPIVPELPESYLFLQRFSGVTNGVSNYQELKVILDNLSDYAPDVDRAREAIEYYFGFIDGENCKRVVAEITKNLYSDPG